MTIPVAVFGATGRLGALICSIVEEDPRFTLVAALRSTSDPAEATRAQIVVDVTHPEVSPVIVERAIRLGQRVIIGTSGWSQERLTQLEELVAGIPESGVLVVPNFSLGSVVGTALARIAGRFFDAIEIVETHHPGKIDSPSGTAVRTAELIAQDREGVPIEAPHADQEARGVLVSGIPVHSLRLAGVVAQQSVRLGGAGETLTITHDTQSSESYRGGVLAALSAVTVQRGLTVGLDGLLGLSEILQAGEQPASNVP